MLQCCPTLLRDFQHQLEGRFMCFYCTNIVRIIGTPLLKLWNILYCPCKLQRRVYIIRRVTQQVGVYIVYDS